MKQQVYSLQNLAENKIHRYDDHQNKMCSYFQITSKNFDFKEYNHGTKEMKEKYQISTDLFRYFNKRKFLFSKFEQGIQLDRESWFSVIPESVSLYLLERIEKTGVRKIFQPFSGVGGIAIHLFDHFDEYLVNDIDLNKLKMLKHNLQVYGKNGNGILCYNNDFLVVQEFKTDALIVCPPWGGIDTNQYSYKDLDEIMNPKLSDILTKSRRYTENIILQMPKNTNLENLIKIIHLTGCSNQFTIEKILTNGNISQLFIYFGCEKFTQINNGQLYHQIYQDLHANIIQPIKNQTNNKIQKKKTKLAIKENCRKIMGEIYTVQCPQNKNHIYFT